MKRLFKLIVVKVLLFEARLVLRRFRPKIIAVAGSVGKTSTKDAIHRVLTAGGVSARKSDKSYNSADFGISLTILGCQSAWNDPLGWLEIMVYGLTRLVTRSPYPKWLVLEVGLEYPGEIKSVLKWLPIDIAVITLLPEVPVHVEFFKTKEEVINEKMLVAKKVGAEGQVFLNADDPNQQKFIPDLAAEVISYGLNEAADYRAGESKIYSSEAKDSDISLPAGLEFTLYHNKKELAVRVPGVIGLHQIYPILPALAVGEKLGLNMIEMIKSLALYLPPAGRLRLLPGIKDTLILDDTYNASPVAMSAGLAALGEFKNVGRKIAVLGDMLQLGSHTVEAHKKIGREAAMICDLVITVGLRSKFIDESLIEAGFPSKRIKHFADAVEAGRFLQEQIKPKDVIFLKGSQAVRLEKAVEEIMAEPERKGELLARQGKEWVKR